MKTFKVTVDGQSYTVQVEEINSPSNNNSIVHKSVTPGHNKDVKFTSERTNITEANKENETKTPKIPEKTVPKQPMGEGFKVDSPMPGSILDVKVSVGDSINEGDVLLVLEAMKMENEITSPYNGEVTEVLVKKGDSVNSGDPLVVLS
ncbi:MAG: biotin/lipoyl-containing protein [Bacillota bacterium]|nr:biotin/lipoyl-containing protein [Bacillota bacterium]